MSNDAINSITAAEESARQAILAAKQDANRRVADAEASSTALFDSIAARADDEVRSLLETARKKADHDAEDLNGSIANRCAAVSARAETRLDDAARLIVERIVSG